MSKFTILPLSVFLCFVTFFLCTESFSDQNDFVQSSECLPFLVKRDQRRPIVTTEFGEISTVQIGERYNLQFITMEPNAVLLPLLLHSDMVFFVHTGTGTLNWVEEDREITLELKQGDVYRLRSGTVFYIQSNEKRDEVTEKLRVYAIFEVEECLYDPCLGAYSNIRDLVLGFDERTLRTAFAVPEDVLRKLRDAVKPPLITNASPRNRTQVSEETWQSRLVSLFVREEDVIDHLALKPIVNSKNKNSKMYNVFESDPDFENSNGRSIVVDEKDLDALKGSSFGVFMVNLTKGSILGPHWNPNACELSIVLRGSGMVLVVNKSKSERLMVEEGDVFVVPKLYPMAQMSFENGAFVFMGFSTWAKTSYPQFLVGQGSVLNVLDREVVTVSFNLSNETMERLFEAQKESVMFECVSCAEGELAKLMREIGERRKREEEEIERRRKAEEEARKKEEERKREEEEAKRREEERRRREEEETERRRKEEEEAKRQEEERKRREEEEEARKREEEREREEEEARRQEEERKRREREEEIAKKREEERRRKEREEAERKRREEEAERKRREEEEERKRREEEARKREEEREREEERKREEEREREEERKREEEAAKRAEEEIARKQEEERRRRRDTRRRKKNEREKRRQRLKEEEEERRRQEEEEEEEEEEKRRWPPQPQPPTGTGKYVAED